MVLVPVIPGTYVACPPCAAAAPVLPNAQHNVNRFERRLHPSTGQGFIPTRVPDVLLQTSEYAARIVYIRACTLYQ